MPSQLQVKFLRVLEEKVIQPLGGISEIEVDVRIVAATHRDLEEMVSQENFAKIYFTASMSFPSEYLP